MLKTDFVLCCSSGLLTLASYLGTTAYPKAKLHPSTTHTHIDVMHIIKFKLCGISIITTCNTLNTNSLNNAMGLAHLN